MFVSPPGALRAQSRPLADTGGVVHVAAYRSYALGGDAGAVTCASLPSDGWGVVYDNVVFDGNANAE